MKALKIPVEICPSCHQQLNWWKEGQPHPILTLYQHRTRVLPGTDDNILFNCDDEQEQKKLDDILLVPEKYAHLSEAEQQQKVAEKRKGYMFS
ncbi:hypothetical protein HT99x_000565 [Candidatus Berkiella aquae]|uniref:Uncharacterized protein n=1 Tax=Candidatus Berkiella aquae TaxID=295108 RepID=A0AAE3L8H0_9GAMM|nr:hypothetical protein [Candidatus Berkiella aquae]